MSHTRTDEIYDQLSSLHRLAQNFDGSMTFGYVTLEMETEENKIREQILKLYRELEQIKCKP